MSFGGLIGGSRVSIGGSRVSFVGSRSVVRRVDRRVKGVVRWVNQRVKGFVHWVMLNRYIFFFLYHWVFEFVC